MIEAANMLLEECDNFRLEDYVMMFQMGKRGELFDVHDRIDLQVITAMLDEYWNKRHAAAEDEITIQVNHLDTLGNPEKLQQQVSLQDAKLLELSSVYSTTMGRMKDFFEPRIGNKEEREKLRQIEKEDTEAIRKQKQEKGYDD